MTKQELALEVIERLKKEYPDAVCVIIVSYDYWLLFTYHYSARCFSINMPKSRDIQAKIPLPQAIWNEFWLRY